MNTTVVQQAIKSALGASLLMVSTFGYAHDLGKAYGSATNEKPDATAGGEGKRSATYLGHGAPARESADEDKDYDGPTRVAQNSMRFQPATLGTNRGDEADRTHGSTVLCFVSTSSCGVDLHTLKRGQS